MILSRRAVLGGLIASIPATAPAIAMGATFAALNYPITPVAIADGVWMVAGADEPIRRDNGGAIANITIIDTPAGTVLVDSGPSLRYGEALKAAAEQLTGRKVIRVYITHLHPDHAMGLGAFPQEIVAALPGTIADIQRDGQGFSDGMYRLLDDWMRGTDLKLPGLPIRTESESFGGRTLRLMALSGHSSADLAILDEHTGTLIGGDLLFHRRAPATPTADLARWRESLGMLDRLLHKSAVPGHGPFDPSGREAIAQTRDWIDWLDQSLTDAVRSGLDMVEAGEMAIPAPLSVMAAGRYELQRSVSHFYPALEGRLLPRIDKV
ncbi:quinoprotein relay system zinc metallohydrolase 1 [Novosphingobium rosa]|uniref:quinoprotein relay system zinc metallohydrolase 1 n=1 Tax=Novosphingobium rosa TaxID=76978 RepID=UPI0008364034|nr:quinoprotein relay system zinc metallohydrolase 1 [Novosphingobium rosa]